MRYTERMICETCGEEVCLTIVTYEDDIRAENEWLRAELEELKAAIAKPEDQ